MKGSTIKINILRIIIIILILGTFGIIFGFSSQDSEKSSGISRKITEVLTSNIKSIQEKPKAKREKILDRIESIIRKIAHFSIYTVVGILLMILFKTYNIGEMNGLSASLIIGVIYASFDEIHQCFIPGRGPQVTDIVIDSMGVLFGILLVLLIQKIYKKIILRKNSIKEYNN